MGTLLGHIAPGLALALVGLWHSINTIRSYFINGPSNFRIMYYFPLKTPSKFEHIELIFILSFSILAIIFQILDFPYLRFAFKLDNFEHATMFLHLAIFSGLALWVELHRSLETLSGFVGILTASVFGQELFLLHFHSADHVEVEEHYHWLLQLIVVVSFVAASAAFLSPTSFPLALILSSAVVFQGLWFVNMGLVLWVPHLVPRGCAASLAESDMVGAIVCGSEKAYMRARALANLQFSWIFGGILLVTGLVGLRFAGKCKVRDLPGEYERLRSKGPEVQIAVNSFKLADPSEICTLPIKIMY